MSAECLDSIGIVQVALLDCSVKLCVSMMMVLVVVRMALYVWWEDRQNVRGEWKYATMVHGLHCVIFTQMWPPPSADNLDTMDWDVRPQLNNLSVSCHLYYMYFLSATSRTRYYNTTESFITSMFCPLSAADISNCTISSIPLCTLSPRIQRCSAAIKCHRKSQITTNLI